MKFEDLMAIIIKRKKEMPQNSYVVSMFKNPDRLMQKIGEEATEVVIAGKNNVKQRIIEEVADLLFHILALLVYFDISLDDITKEFKKRNKKDH